MTKNKNISDKQKEKILCKCIALISRGYSFEYCEAKFKRYGNVLEEYLPILIGLKKLRRDDPSDVFLKNTLHKIYNDSSSQDEYIENSYKIKTKTNSMHSILKPAIIFITVVLFFCFSFAGILFASQNSLPSNPLYPVKRYGENIKLLIAPESKKNILHYQMLNNRLNETELFLNSPEKEKKKLDNLIWAAEEEFNQCKKYNFFGNYTEEEIKDLIEKIKEEAKSIEEFNPEDDQESDLKENTSSTSDNSETDDSDSTGEDEKDDSLVNDQANEGKEEAPDQGINGEKSNNTDNAEIVDEKESGDYQETSDESKIEENRETDNEVIIVDDEKTGDDTGIDDSKEDND